VPVVVPCCGTAPDPFVPDPWTPSYSNTDQAQACCCWPAKSNVARSVPAHGAKAGDAAAARTRIEGARDLVPGQAIPRRVGAIGPPPLWLTAKTSTRRPARSPPSRNWSSGSRWSPPSDCCVPRHPSFQTGFTRARRRFFQNTSRASAAGARLGVTVRRLNLRHHGPEAIGIEEAGELRVGIGREPNEAKPRDEFS
jgi:hypothetical protein